MSGDDTVDVIVVGAGPAGAACAYRLARAGRSVVLIERGSAAGSKNVSGGRLYTYALETVGEGLSRAAPWERAVVREQLMLMDADRSMTVSLAGSSAPDGHPPASVTVLRATFDEWLAGEAEAAGAVLATGIRVDSLLEKNGRVVGIMAGGEEMRAEVVVAADGVNSFLARQAGLVGELPAGAVAVGVKETIALDAATIESRFGVPPGQGVATLMLGCTSGVRGGAFLYTNRDSVSLGVVAAPDGIPGSGRAIHTMLRDLKTHPAIGPLIDGGTTVEYAAHLVREDGQNGVPKRLTRDGFLVTGEAAGFVVNAGYTVRGMDLALLSGAAAADAILSGGALEPGYRAALGRAGLPAVMAATAGHTRLLAIERLYRAYPDLVLDIAESVFTVDGSAPRRIRHQVRDAVRAQRLPLRTLLRDGVTGVGAL